MKESRARNTKILDVTIPQRPNAKKAYLTPLMEYLLGNMSRIPQLQ